MLKAKGAMDSHMHALFWSCDNTFRRYTQRSVLHHPSGHSTQSRSPGAAVPTISIHVSEYGRAGHYGPRPARAQNWQETEVREMQHVAREVYSRSSTAQTKNLKTTDDRPGGRQVTRVGQRPCTAGPAWTWTAWKKMLLMLCHALYVHSTIGNLAS